MKKVLFTLMVIAACPGLRSDCCASDKVDLQSEMYRGNNMLFIENKGQITDQHGNPRHDIDFKLHSGNLNVFIGKGKIEYQWVTANDSVSYKTWRTDVQLEHFNPDSKLQAGTSNAYQEQYYTQSVQASVSSYDRVIYRDIYPKIDWVLYADKDKQLKYDFIVREGGNPADIKIKYSGADDLVLDAAGNLQVKTPMGTITEKAPYSFVGNGAEEIEIASGYVLENSYLSFYVAAYEGILTIDPEIEWATFYGGDSIGGNDPWVDYAINSVERSAVDNWGNVFIGGKTNAVNNIATTGAFLQELSGNQDFYVAKFNSKGDRLWATYYYGTKQESGYLTMYAMVADHSGNIYFTTQGGEYIENFCTENAHQDTVVGGHANLVKLSGSGERLWATYYGGLQPRNSGNGGTMWAKSIAVDKNNNVFLMGETQEMNNFDYGGIYNIIATKGAHKEEHTYGQYTARDIFIAKFDSAGVRQWGTYYGGLNHDQVGGFWSGGTGKSSVTDSEGNLYIIGHTRSDDGISTPGSHQEDLTVDNFYNDDADAFLAKFSPEGELLWGTYYGGMMTNDAFYAIDIDSEENLILIGNTSSKDKITSPGSFQDTLNFPFFTERSWGASIITSVSFLAKFDKTGNRIWGSYFHDPAFDVLKYGANWGIGIVDMAVDHHDNYWVLLSTYYEGDFYKKGNQWSNYAQRQNNILIQFSNDSIAWSSYIASDFQSLNVDRFSNLYLAGMAVQDSYVSPGAHSEDFISQYQTGYLMKANVCQNPSTAISPANLQPISDHCPNSTVTFTVDPGFDSYKWTLPSGWTGNSDSSSIVVQVGNQSGTIGVSGTYQCGESGEITLNVTVIDVASIDFSLNGDTLYAKGYESYTWYYNGNQIEGNGDHVFLGQNYGSYKLVAVTTEGCVVEATYEHKEKLSIETYDISSLRVYPNPASASIKVELNQKAQYVISDIEGRRLISTLSNDIDISNLTPGIYILQIQDSNGSVLKNVKFVKHVE